jgi:class 3 adenylate cyclase/tetratricopeptide (TPR) repeat protein
MCAARSIALECESCGRASRTGARFCDHCGRALERVSPGPLGERRQLTVLFCDLVSSTRLAGRLDPEVLLDVIRRYQALCSRAVARLDGRVAQLLGDGVLVYFGHPRAHEDDPLRAIQTALAVIEGLDDLNRESARSLPEMHGERLRVRIGIHTGPVVVDQLGAQSHGELLALGDTVNLAAGLLGLADSDCVVVSRATRDLAGAAVEVADLGAQAVKGRDEPVEAFRVVRVSPRWESAPAVAQAPFVGRHDLLDVLRERLERAAHDGAQTVLVEGEPGIGKSRLARELNRKLEGSGIGWLWARCTPHHDHSALFPLTAMLAARLGLGSELSQEERLGRLEQAFDRASVPLFAELFSLAVPDRLVGPLLSAEARRRRTLEAIIGWLGRQASAAPLVLVVEDLQWIDPSTLELLGMLREHLHAAPLLLIGNFRPGGRPPWPDSERLLCLHLVPLGTAEVVSMAEGMLGGRTLPDEVRDELLAKTDGVPLFVEELTRLLVERGIDALRTLGEKAVPATLQGSLMARLDRLGEHRTLAQLAAVIGREFTHALLAATSDLPADELDRGLLRLQEAGIVRAADTDAPSRRYAFRHALIRDTAYASLLRSRRREHHRHVADVLEQHDPDQALARPELLAWHFQEADDASKAVAYYLRAGDVAFARSAHLESIHHYERGLELIPRLPEGRDRSGLELRLRIGMGAPLMSTRGYGSPEAEECHRCARALCGEVGQGPDLYQAIGGLYLFHQGRLDLDQASELAGQLLRLGQDSSDRFVQQWGHFFSGVPLYYRGDYAGSLRHLERAMEFAPSAARPDWFVHEHDVLVSALSYGAMALWTVGEVERAQQSLAAAIDLGRKSRHPFNHAFAQSWAAFVHQMRGDAAGVLRSSEEVMEICAEQGFSVYHGVAQTLHGWARVAATRDEQGLAELRDGLKRSAATGTRTEAPRMLGVLADAYRRIGRRSQALATLGTALDFSRQYRSPYWDAELLRLRGDVLLLEDPEALEPALEEFQRAAGLARAQGALSLELRAVSCAARCLERAGRREAGADWLAEVSGRFAKGVAAPELAEAQAQLRAWRS